jgi:hypothetical protein
MADYGVDTLNPITKQSLDALVADKKLGAPPQFWARYIHSTSTQAKNGQFDPDKEGKVLSDAGIPLLPIARQTRDVAGDDKLGAKHGKDNVAALANIADDVRDKYLFLDVEDDPTTKSPAMSKAYWAGWAMAVADAQVLPCLYIRAASVATLKALKDATDDGSPFEVLWIARWLGKGPMAPPKAFDPMAKYLKGLTDLKFDPKVLDPKQHIAVWQYANGDHYDFDVLHMAAKDNPLKHLIEL